MPYHLWFIVYDLVMAIIIIIINWKSKMKITKRLSLNSGIVQRELKPKPHDPWIRKKLFNTLYEV